MVDPIAVEREGGVVRLRVGRLRELLTPREAEELATRLLAEAAFARGPAGYPDRPQDRQGHVPGECVLCRKPVADCRCPGPEVRHG